jgi:two-component system OmpR family sensor kinase
MLMLASLVITEGVGLALIVNGAPRYQGPVQLSDVARQLRLPSDGPPPSSARGPGQRSLFGGSPPPSPPHGGPPPDAPPDGSPPPGERSVLPDADLVVTASVTPPAPSSSAGSAASTALRNDLAQLLGIEPASVVFHADALEHIDTLEHGEATLRRNFLAARQLPGGRWRIVRREIEGFPNALQRRALMLFAIGLAALLPLAWAFARTLETPIRRFAEAARRMGQDSEARLLPRRGPPEMLAAVDSFNAMQGRINRLIQERTHMVGAIAHDLRTPLTRLAFRLDDLPHPLREKVDADIQEMTSMISAALDFIRDRSLNGQHERLDFRLLVERVINDQSDLGHDVTLEGGMPITIEGAPLALRRMVSNLIDNALKYGERASARLHTAFEHCILEIDDDGPGIPEQLQRQVFEPFYRLEASRNRFTGGIGLGLATVRAIVLDHGGQITLGNRKTGGLRVTISLRMARP